MLRIRACHPLRGFFPEASPRIHHTISWSYYPDAALPRRRFGLFPVRSPLLGESLLFSSPAGTKMFQFPAFAPCKNRVTALQAAGLSHSEIDGSRDICSYPSLFAAYHVLHRLCEPRHPPCALYYFLAARCLLQCHHNMKPAVTEDVSLLSFLSTVLFCLVPICQRSLYIISETDFSSTKSLGAELGEPCST